MLPKYSILISINSPQLRLTACFVRISRSSPSYRVFIWMTFHIAGSLQILCQVLHTFLALLRISNVGNLWIISTITSWGIASQFGDFFIGEYTSAAEVDAIEHMKYDGFTCVWILISRRSGYQKPRFLLERSKLQRLSLHLATFYRYSTLRKKKACPIHP